MVEDADRLRILKRFEDEMALAKRMYDKSVHRVAAEFNRRMQELEIGVPWRTLVVLKTIEFGCRVEEEWISDAGGELTVAAKHFFDSNFGKARVYRRFKRLLDCMEDDELIEKVSIAEESYSETWTYKVTDYGRRFINDANNGVDNEPT
jgi:hypothetical protein